MPAESEHVHQPTVLIITDEVEFSRLLTARWQAERNSTAFAVMGSDVCSHFGAPSFDLAVVGGLSPAQFEAAALSLAGLSAPVLFVCDGDHVLDRIGTAYPRALVVRRHEGWVEAAVLVAAEILRRCEAVDRARRAEQANATLDRQATLGRYMLEMRHTLNNALTSVLGNAELLLLEPGCLSAEARSQLEIIRNMALRMNEVLRRFTSIEKEMTAVDRANHNPPAATQVASAAS